LDHCYHLVSIFDVRPSDTKSGKKETAHPIDATNLAQNNYQEIGASSRGDTPT
jgi:hypothetical protein